MRICAVRVLDITQERIDSLGLLISLEKRNKIQRLINRQDKLRALIGEILIRTMIVEERSIDNGDIIFEKNRYGKPYLRNYQGLDFNISHSGDFVICAIDNKPIGVDIEEIKNIEYQDIAKEFFTFSEFQYITKRDSHSCLSKFYEVWTLKESYIKCCGKGLTIPLKSFSIDKDNYGGIKIVHGRREENYTLETFDFHMGYKVSVCSKNKIIANPITILDQNQLINTYVNMCIQ